MIPFSDDDTLPKGLVRIVDLALEEDIAGGDVTSEALFGENDRSRGVVVARENGIMAGFPIFKFVFERLSGKVECFGQVPEGDRFEAGMEIIRLNGPTITLMKGERTALNFLQRLCGIATRTKRLVDRLEGSGITLLDTRKTTPGHRLLEKYAVRVGGGENHRLDLSGMILVKENHIAAVGGVEAALKALTDRFGGTVAIEVEVRNLEELDVVLKYGIDRVMLDNFSPGDVREAVDRIAERLEGRERPRVEVSGGVGEDNIEAYRIDGIDYISIGSLTHSVRALDLSMIIRGESF